MILQRVVCAACGASDWEDKGSTKVCRYCGSVYALSKEESSSGKKAIPSSPDQSTASEIALNDDVERLLKKCRTDPKNARKYANLVLDIDPTNREALKYL